MFISTALAAAAEHAPDAAHAPGAFYTAPEFWVAIAFLMVVAYAAKPVGKGIAAALDTRAAKIKARMDEAERLRKEAQDLLATYQRKQREAMQEAEDIVNHARAEVERVAAQAAADLEASLARREKQALDRIAHAEAQARKEVQDAAVDIAIAAARRVIADSMSPQQSARLIDQALDELPGKLH